MKKTFPLLHILAMILAMIAMLSVWLFSDNEPKDPLVIELLLRLDETPTTTIPTKPALAQATFKELVAAKKNNTTLVYSDPEQTAATPETSAIATTPKLVKKMNWQTVTVKSGDNLTSLFLKVGLTPQAVYKVSHATKKQKAFRKLTPGQTLDFSITQGRLEALRHNISQLEQDTITLQDDVSYVFEKRVREPLMRQEFVTGVIHNSLFLDGQKAGLSQKKIMEMAKIFGWDIDFALDIRVGDTFSVMYEDKYLDNRKIGESNILATQFVNQGRVVNAIRYTDGNYYNEKGYSMRKAFLRSPVDFFRISSKYNLKRLHPTLKKVRPHRGVDYAAARGTPIKAAGDGKVIWKGTKGGYGRTVIIQHAGIYTTLYAHMSKYNKRIKTGSRVKQGQVIGYIGSSGTATGPHLHYEFRANGVHKNPLKVTFPNIHPLNKKEMKEFTPLAERMIKVLNVYKQGLS